MLPHCLDDYVSENNPVRVIEAFIDELDLARLGFGGVVPETTRSDWSSHPRCQDPIDPRWWVKPGIQWEPAVRVARGLLTSGIRVRAAMKSPPSSMMASL